uniref:BZIP domain-containing protein n=1 Tax=Triparma pacifica TaxID=91992 RepID=A0A7S2QUW0_9STRA|mmetsp:Transcript_1372/g.2478  ORF Transcript_1372/g.2478 Transcript_1372/m.2478 type:complete len:146 (+) Transcript_1372:220-657(+)
MDVLAALCNASDPKGVEMLPQTKTASCDSIKKMQRRESNRKSAQLSRKRKKEFIEELESQIYDLKKRFQILRHIPDLVVVFNIEDADITPSESMNCVPPKANSVDFASDAALKLLRMTPEDMQGRSIWDYFSPSSRNSLQLGLKR